jgi:hypothetical protein
MQQDLRRARLARDDPSPAARVDVFPREVSFSHSLDEQASILFRPPRLVVWPRQRAVLEPIDHRIDVALFEHRVAQRRGGFFRQRVGQARAQLLLARAEPALGDEETIRALVAVVAQGFECGVVGESGFQVG